MKALFCAGILIALVSVHAASAISSNWFFAERPGGIRCVDIFLPDDSGYTGEQEYTYKIECSPAEECIEWGASVTEESVTAGWNNTAKVPVCFIVPEYIPLGNCSGPLIISLSSEDAGISRQWEGGVCASEQRDFEVAERIPDQSVSDVLNKNLDLFDIGFEQAVVYSRPGEIVNYTLSAYSHADIELSVYIDSEAGVSRRSFSLNLSEDNPEQDADIIMTAPLSAGEYGITATAKVEGCDSGYCSRTARGKLIVSENGYADRKGFEISLLPESINVKQLEPVRFKLTVTNYGERQVFRARFSANPNDGSASSNEREMDINSGEKGTAGFIFSPGSSRELYEINVVVESESGDKKTATSYLSTNEMVSDALRMVEGIKDAEKKGDAERAVTKWYRDYKNKSYEEIVKDYNSLSDLISRQEQPSSSKPETPSDGSDSAANETQDRNDERIPLWVYVLVAMAVVFALVYHLSSKKGNKDMDDFYQ